ncbi:hypothetical protein EB796_024502 [Bugula neritina]|uniref:Uncharacterized protein n=1 Tax=Bugula neritina TaxID=10212 RepID=A0A7J7ITC3_BUGNE|nr:hypothetical protein EB796_024502 [Bugula neritina]
MFKEQCCRVKLILMCYPTTSLTTMTRDGYTCVRVDVSSCTFMMEVISILSWKWELPWNSIYLEEMEKC